MADSYASLASSTGTSIESASKHNIQCKVSTDHILQWVQDAITTGESATVVVKKDKMNYSMHKNDIVVGVRQGWFPDSSCPNKAYPAVVTTYANMCLPAQYWLMLLYNNAKNMKDVRMLVHESLHHREGGGGKQPLLPHAAEQMQINSMPQFYFAGVSLGVAYAHLDSGDTVGTVMFGGLRTVLNGPCKANTGQPMMWIFSFEARCFDIHGRRIFANKELPDVVEDGMAKVAGQNRSCMASMDMKTMDRKMWHDRENGNITGHQGKTNVFWLIPYVRNEDGAENILDRDRVCGMYISSAREFEMVDIKLQRQAI